MKKNRLKAFVLSMCAAIPLLGVSANVSGLDIPDVGDINGDGKVSIADLVDLQRQLLGIKSCSSVGDLNFDGSVDVFDLCILRNILKDSVVSSPSVTYTSKNITADLAPAGSSTVDLDEEFVMAQTSFSLELFKRVLKEDENTLISPYSVSQAIAMTANGADGDIKAEMENALGGMKLEKLNNCLSTMRASQLNDDQCKLSTANSIWMRQGLNVYPEFLRTAVDYYNADCFTAPFDETTVEDINKWVENKTDKMIPTIIDGIGPNSMMYLINAVAFDAKWESPFEMTFNGNFTASDGIVKETDMMSSVEYTFIEDENSKGILKYYKNKKYAFAAILPNEDISITDYVSGLTPESFNAMLSETQHKGIWVEMPKFSFDYEATLNSTLSDMGMPTPFMESVQAFPKISDLQLRISDVCHKTHIDVDEDGTKAAAVTSVELVTDSCVMFDEVIDFNRPFLFSIIDTETNIPIFIGTLSDINN